MSSGLKIETKLKTLVGKTRWFAALHSGGRKRPHVPFIWSLFSSPVLHTHAVISVVDRMIWYTAGHCAVLPLNHHYTFTNHCEPQSKTEGSSSNLTRMKRAQQSLSAVKAQCLCVAVKLSCYSLIVLQRHQRVAQRLCIRFTKPPILPWKREKNIIYKGPLKLW